ncbi:terminase [Mergibacter septicus]|uniref:Terminase n=1 Tax=Mergibacter septicus TaxID=221402 RepID=A0A8D4LJJ3_9PAST|nr:phage terminase small subunit [Mergibacter septicus]AWX15610.1 terminase [Mergibacter septicus]QDJ13088.1 terminase [Mergibacter septicus]QDJ14864.1 terminase [Mergibacter septicus]UTU47708.1 terminase [Mergibacter septicus]WMR96685.1 phage terminase small subunit [Mergibacter septicus]
MRSTKAHYLKTIAGKLSANEEQQLEQLEGYEKMLFLLSRHKKDLKNIQSREKKAEFKRKILNDYRPWIEGALQQGTGKQDNILMTWLVWAIDCGEYQLAIEIGEYALFHDLVLPDGFSRTPATLLAEEFADKAKASQTGFELDLLIKVEKVINEEDMPDESRARLLREIGLLQKELEPEKSLANLQRALQLNPNIGVKGEVKKLLKQLDMPDETLENEPDSETE